METFQFRWWKRPGTTVNSIGPHFLRFWDFFLIIKGVLNTVASPYESAGMFVSADFNRRGTRLLYGLSTQPLVVFFWCSIRPSEEQMDGAVGKVRLTSQGFSLPSDGWNTMCFAGKDDELVVAASQDRSLHVWSLLDSILCQSIFFFNLKSKSKSNSCKLFINQN